ncbi:MAG: hypothetical protein Q8Q12_02755 [bacterium]|nr:hypothetical protein [bacterium]
MLRSLTMVGSVLATLLSASCLASLADFLWQESERDAADNLGLMLEELASPKVSGEELAPRAQKLQQRWQEYMTQRGKMASALADVASLYEERNRFSEALAIYESLWEHFPEQQELIGKIKRDRALAEIPIDLSTPEKAFFSLKRGLLTYKLTSATFGVADPSTILYEPEPIERHEVEADLRRLESRLAQPLECSTDSTNGGPKADWPRPVRDPWRNCVRYSSDFSPASLKVRDATALDIMDRLIANFPVPVFLTPGARAYLAELSRRQETSEERFSVDLQDIPAHHLLQYVLERVLPKGSVPFWPLLNAVEGRFVLHIRHATGDQIEPILTLVIQHEPVVPFPDDVESESEAASDSLREFLASSVGLEKLPEQWLAHLDAYSSMEIFAAPISALQTWSQMTHIPESGVYYGRVVPLFRCLRAYPLVGPRPDPYGDPKPKYILDVQVGWQKRRMSKFLDDRLGIVALLMSRLIKVEERIPSRFIPQLDLPPRVLELASRLGLWYDGKAYRFLLFDSEEDRERWLKGEDWLDMPSDLDDYEWPSEEELEKKWKELEKNVEKGVITIPDLSDQ